MSHRVLDRYTRSSILKVGLGTALLASLMLMGVDLFSNIYTYMNHNISLTTAFGLTLLYFPESFLLAVGPSFMFAVSYHLSMLHSSNEVMCVLNSGTSFSRLLRPCIVMAIVMSFLYFGFNETVAIRCSNLKMTKTEQLTNSSGSDRNNQDIALSDMQQGYMVYASRYSDANQTLYDVSMIECEADGSILRRINAYKATYDNSTGHWLFYDTYFYTPQENGNVSIQGVGTYESPNMTLEPQLFRNVSNEISRMSLDLAYAYLKRMKVLNPTEYASIGTEFYKRVFSCLTPLVMIVIACSMNYRFKKNVLFFSLICSICISVVYYVIQMVTVMLSDQGVIAPQLGILIPFMAILMLSFVLGTLLRRQ
ncbi:MAG: LptF/LptG family permease [Sphaerochaetaceae bacterium]|nr:LptF/LptG family permease [Sphaerochaetaceae bacterium]